MPIPASAKMTVDSYSRFYKHVTHVQAHHYLEFHRWSFERVAQLPLLLNSPAPPLYKVAEKECNDLDP